MNYYGLTFETAVDRQQKPVPIIRVDPGDDATPRRAVEVLHAGGLIVFPTDAGYLVGCAAGDASAVARLCEVTGATRDQLRRFSGTPEPVGASDPSTQPLRHPVPLGLMQAANLSMVATAVPPGAPPAPSAQHVVFMVGDAVDLVLNAGPVRRPAAAGGR